MTSSLLSSCLCTKAVDRAPTTCAFTAVATMAASSYSYQTPGTEHKLEAEPSTMARIDPENLGRARSRNGENPTEDVVALLSSHPPLASRVTDFRNAVEYG